MAGTLHRRVADFRPGDQGLAPQDPATHLSRINKLATIDDLMKGFGLNENKPKSQRGASNLGMPALPNPPRSSRNEKYKDKGQLYRFDSVDKPANFSKNYNNMLKVKLPSLYKQEQPVVAGKTIDRRPNLAGQLANKEPLPEADRNLVVRNQSQLITVKRRPPEAEDKLEAPNSLVLNFAVKTRAGRVGPNRKINQDNYITNQIYLSSADNIFFAVFDGHGTDGHKVSHHLKLNLANAVAKELKKSGVTDESLFSEAAHAAVIRAFLSTDNEMNKNNPSLTDVSGSTCVSVVAMKDKLICANLGDSCAALVSCDGEDWSLQMLNREHKPTEKDERDRVENSNGRVEPFRDQFGQFIGPLRVWRKHEQVPGLMMSRSFGDARAHTCGVISVPEIRNFKLDRSSRALVLGSDGLWEVLQQDRIKSTVAKYHRSKRSEEAASELLESSQTAWSKKNPMYCDDITCVVVYLNAHYFEQRAPAS